MIGYETVSGVTQKRILNIIRLIMCVPPLPLTARGRVKNNYNARACFSVYIYIYINLFGFFVFSSVSRSFFTRSGRSLFIPWPRY